MTAILASCLLLTVLAGQAPEKGRCTVYMYLDDQGNSVRTRKYDSIPEAKKNTVVIYQDCSPKLEKRQSFSYVQEKQESLSGYDLPILGDGDSSVFDFIRRRHRELDQWQVILVLLGLAAFLGGLIGMAVSAFRISPFWGLGVLLLPILPPVFAAMYWRDNQAPFLAWLGGGLVAGLIGFIG